MPTRRFATPSIFFKRHRGQELVVTSVLWPKNIGHLPTRPVCDKSSVFNNAVKFTPEGGRVHVRSLMNKPGSSRYHFPTPGSGSNPELRGASLTPSSKASRL